ncbi:MAG: MBL fold metallo-hydrolase [Clostridiales bacterium]|nr:MBL fold metallo-hydrolase [Clostridiales bacterium]
MREGIRPHSIEITPLFSGSSGNSILVSTSDTMVLVDAGMNCKKVVEALNIVGVEPAELSAVLITHDHSDHIGALDVFTRKFGIPVFATRNTWEGIHTVERKPHDAKLDHEIRTGTRFSIGRFDVIAFDTPHDTSGSCGYRFFTESCSASIATDMGIMTPEIFDSIKGSDGILLEANYDRDMLWNGEYPYILKRRIDGQYGHLCNDDCARAIAQLCKCGTRHFILGHLSKENNLPQVAERTVLRALSEEKLVRDKDFTLRIANRYTPTAPLLLEAEDEKIYLQEVIG